MTYFEVIKSRRDYKGERYFKFDPMAEKVIQVTINAGEIKKGRPAMFGVGLISRITFMCNYLSYGYVKEISKEEYNKQFNKTVKMLQ